MRTAKQEKENEKMADEEKLENKNLTNSFTYEMDMKVNSGETFKGTFTIHRPTIGERLKIGVLEAQKIGGLANIDVYTSGIAHMVATLEVVIDKAPVWWKPEEIRDLEVVQAVWEFYINRLQEFQAKPQA